MSDRVFLDCQYCGWGLSTRFPKDKSMPPSMMESWYLRIAKHIRREHVGTGVKEKGLR